MAKQLAVHARLGEVASLVSIVGVLSPEDFHLGHTADRSPCNQAASTDQGGDEVRDHVDRG